MRKTPVAVFALLLAACSSSADDGATTETNPGVAVKRTVCLASARGGLDDLSFNAAAFAGAKQAHALFGWDVRAVDASTTDDYAPNMEKFVVAGDCTLIVGLSYAMIDVMQKAAAGNGAQKFQLLDATVEPPLPNVWGQVYATHEAAFLAGYVAAAMTKTGVVATFGGTPDPPVTDFMEGFTLGVRYHNEKNGTVVRVLGWSVENQTGTFTGNYIDIATGQKVATEFIEQGADVILPVAGRVGFGAGDALIIKGSGYLIGVDTDWTISAAPYKNIVLTSIVKKLDKSVVSAIRAIQEGAFSGGTKTSTLANGEVDIAPFHDLDPLVPARVKADLAVIRTAIIAGKIPTTRH
jgi:basic membrane protein A and related proteins